MNQRLLLVLIVIGFLNIPVGRCASDDIPEPTMQLSLGQSNTIQVDWQSVSGRTYFIQCSSDLAHWRYLPFVAKGTGQAMHHSLVVPSANFFVRLRYTDQMTADPETEDFDNDGISNLEEVALHGTDPFNRDSDGDGLSDGWEVSHAGVLALNPEAFSATVQRGEIVTQSGRLYNGTDRSVNYAINLSNNTTADYSYEDSLTGSVTYLWEDTDTHRRDGGGKHQQAALQVPNSIKSTGRETIKL